MGLGTPFLVDDEKIAWMPPPSASPSGEGGGHPLPDRERFLGALLHAAETTGTFIAAATSVVNFASRYPHRARTVLVDLPTWLPAPPQILTARPEHLVRLAVPLIVINRLNDLPIHLDIACDVTRRHCATASRNQSVSPAAIDDLVPLWGAVAESAVALLHDLAPSASTDAVPPRLVYAERLLTAAALGAYPCVSADGEIEIPGWIERRLDRRHRLRLVGSLIVDGRAWPIETVDLSRRGAGLSRLPQLSVGRRALLVLDGLEAAAGTIVWLSGDRGGLRFDNPLESLAKLGRTLER